MATARILLVDDETLYLSATSRLLSIRGYDVVPAPGPSQALEIVRNSRPFDVVVSDVAMPEMRGTQLVGEIAKLSPRTGRLLMTGGQINPAENPDGVPVLRKPLSTEDLLCAVETLLERSAIRRADHARDRDACAELQNKSRQLASEYEEVFRRSTEDRGKVARRRNAEKI